MNLGSRLSDISDTMISDLKRTLVSPKSIRVNTIKPTGTLYCDAQPMEAGGYYRGTGYIPCASMHPKCNFPGEKVLWESKVTNPCEEVFNKQTNKKDSIMSLFNSIPGLSGNSFGKLTGNRIAIGFDGQIVFRKPDGSYVKLVTDEEGNKTQVQVLDLKLDVDFYRVPTQQLQIGDLIELDGALVYVEENTKGGLKFVNPLTGNKTNKLQQTNIFNMYFYTKIVSLFDLANGGQAGIGLNGINPMMMLALQGKSGASGDISELLLLSSLMGAQGEAGQQAFNPMMLMALGGGAEKDTMQQFMLLQMMAGQGGANPFAPISANVAAAPVVAKAKTTRKAKVVAPIAIKAAAPKKTATKAATRKTRSVAKEA